MKNRKLITNPSNQMMIENYQHSEDNNNYKNIPTDQNS